MDLVKKGCHLPNLSNKHSASRLFYRTNDNPSLKTPQIQKHMMLTNDSVMKVVSPQSGSQMQKIKMVHQGSGTQNPELEIGPSRIRYAFEKLGTLGLMVHPRCSIQLMLEQKKLQFSQMECFSLTKAIIKFRITTTKTFCQRQNSVTDYNLTPCGISVVVVVIIVVVGVKVQVKQSKKRQMVSGTRCP